jgi:hypothetical protein
MFALTTTTGKVVLNGIQLGSNLIAKLSLNSLVSFTILLVTALSLSQRSGRRLTTIFIGNTLALTKVQVSDISIIGPATTGYERKIKYI